MGQREEEEPRTLDLTDEEKHYRSATTPLPTNTVSRMSILYQSAKATSQSPPLASASGD